MLSLQEKYSQAEVVEFWSRLATSGLQAAEAQMLAQYAPPPPGRVLDIGCGAGRVALALAPSGYAVDGLDITAAMVRAAHTLAAQRSVRAGFVQADLCALPFAAGSYDVALIFIAALQHVAGGAGRRDALRQLAGALRAGGVLILALDNIAPALRCYVEWGAARLRPAAAGASGRPQYGSPEPAGATDALLASNRTRMGRLAWHARGLARSLRWRTWEGMRDSARSLHLLAGERGDTQIEQVSMPPTAGSVFYHLYAHAELVEDARIAGLRLLGYHSGNELAQETIFGETARRLDKQVLYAFQKE